MFLMGQSEGHVRQPRQALSQTRMIMLLSVLLVSVKAAMLKEPPRPVIESGAQTPETATL